MGDNALFIDGMKELEEDEKREPYYRLLRVRDHIVEKYETAHEDDDSTSHNKLIAPGNEPETMEDVPIKVDTKKEIKKSKKRRKDSSNDQEEMSKKQEKQKNKKRKTKKRIVLKNLNQFSISYPITSVNVATPPVTTLSKPVENLGFK